MRLPRTARGLSAAGAALALTVMLATGLDRDGPVTFVGDPDTGEATVGIELDGGQAVFGASVVRNGGDRAVTLRGASLVGDVPEEAARLAEARVLEFREHGVDPVGAGPWPVDRYGELSVPLAGYRLEPGVELELLLVVDVIEPGHWRWPRNVLEYEDSSGTAFRATSDLAFELTCSPAATCHG
ncbi:hypothetical protein [Nocardioides pantholopis]|uniref:hypothetical protein n=1 Tax=Nocardioides pantholopis TaxID=2483798 RepID=UPI000FD73702|nr:hypothetical protein [Nocardioides pantholopis]